MSDEQHAKSLSQRPVVQYDQFGFVKDFLIWLDAQDSANQMLRISIKKLTSQNVNAPPSARDGEFEFKEKVDAEILEQAKSESLTFRQSAKAYRRQRW